MRHPKPQASTAQGGPCCTAGQSALPICVQRTIASVGECALLPADALYHKLQPPQLMPSEMQSLLPWQNFLMRSTDGTQHFT